MNESGFPPPAATTAVPNTTRSRNNKSIEHAIKTKDMLGSADVKAILMNLINRKRFFYSFKDILESFFKCLCFRSTKQKQHYLYDKGERKLISELDVVQLLRTIRQTKLLTQVILNQRQKMLLKFQRKNLIETSSSSGDSDSNIKIDAAS